MGKENEVNVSVCSTSLIVCQTCRWRRRIFHRIRKKNSDYSNLARWKSQIRNRTRRSSRVGSANELPGVRCRVKSTLPMCIILYNPAIAENAAFCPSSEMRLALSNSRRNLFTTCFSEDLKSKRLVDHDSELWYDGLKLKLQRIQSIINCQLSQLESPEKMQPLHL